MIDEIKKVKDFILKHCDRRSKEIGVANEDIQVRFSLVETADDIKYHTCKKYAVFEETTFLEICNFKFGIDFMGYSHKVPPFILQGLIYLCEKNGIDHKDIYVFARPDDNYFTQDEDSEVRKKELVAIHVYNKGTWIEKMSVQEFVLSNILSGM